MTLPLARIRAKKSAAEVALIQRATNAGIEAHRVAWKRIRAGLSEFQVAATMSNFYFESGCERHAYSPIVGSGINAATLHYSRNSRKMDSGELLLMDVGPECSMYATDITRTVPVGGKFTPRQRELYDIVLGAQKAAINAVKPGVMLGSRTTNSGIHQLVVDYFKNHGKDKLGKPWTRFYPQYWPPRRSRCARSLRPFHSPGCWNGDYD
ncbi:MAG: M24 family metallopeptidase [Bryobacteraceae bacterium]